MEATLESRADGILVVDRQGRITKFNKKFLELRRIPESIISAGSDERALAFVLDHLRDPDQFLSKVREFYASPWAESYDVIEFKDGRIFERYSKPQVIGNKAVGRVWSFRDVTTLRRADEALRESEAHLKEAQEVAHIGHWEIDHGAGHLIWSEEVYRIFGRSPKSFSPTREAFLETVHPEDREAVSRAFEESLEGRKPYQTTHRIIRPDGNVRIVQERSRIYSDGQGKGIFVLGTESSPMVISIPSKKP